MRICVLAALLLLLASSAFPQTSGGSISGTVTDSQGAVLVGASVDVTDTDTNVATTLKTNSAGLYVSPRNLLPGNYQVTAESTGFKKSVRSGIVLQLGDELQIDMRLEVGALTDSITVSGTTPILETDSVSTGRSLTTQELMTLPVQNNDIVVQAMLAAGVQSSGLTAYVTQGMVNGSSQPYSAAGAVGGSEWSIDGQPNNGNIRRTGYTPTTDAVEEFRVETSNFDATIGHTTGLSVQMQSKSGTNAYHGTASNSYWNTHWNAANFYQKQAFYSSIAAANAAGNTTLANQIAAGPTTAGGHSNNYAGTLGGPVWLPKVYNGKNKLFFFFSFAGADDRQPARTGNINYTVPTQAERAGNFSDLVPYGVQYTVYDPLTVTADPARAGHYIRTAFPGNIIPPSRVGASDPALVAFVNANMPQANVNFTNPTSTNYIATCQIDNSDYKAYDQKTDYQLNANSRISARWNYTHYVEPQGDYTCNGINSSDELRVQKSATVTYTRTINSTTVLDVTGSFTSFIDRFQWLKAHTLNPTSVGLPAYVETYCKADNNSCEAPPIGLAGYQTLSGNSGYSFPFDRTQNFKSNISHVRGRHTLRAGIDYRFQIHSDAGNPGNSSGAINFNNTYTRKDDDGSAPNSNLGESWAAMELGIPSTITIDNNTSQTLSNPYYGFYGQDNWRINNKLSVTLGFRVEYEAGLTDRYNRFLYGFDPAAPSPLAAIAAAAYAKNPQAQLPVGQFNVIGGNLYAGANGASRSPWPGEWMFMPRLSVAWHFQPRTVFRAGFGTYYDTLNVNNESINQGGYSITTTSTTSTNFGQTFNEGNPYAGVSPISNPFPNGYQVPVGNTLGSSYEAGRGYTFVNPHRKHQYVEKWRAGFQRDISHNMVVEAAYWGQWGGNIDVTDNLSTPPASYYNTTETRNLAPGNLLNLAVPNPFNIANFASFQTSNPALYNYMNGQSFFTSATIPLNKLISAYPQMNGLSESNLPYGRDQITAVELNFTRRFSSGFTYNASYTWLHARDKTQINNPYDTYPIWEPGNTSRPRRLTMTGIYEFPFGKGKPFLNKGRIVGQMVGGWEVSGTYQYQPGALIGFQNDFYTGNLHNLRDELETGCKYGCNQINSWFNTSNFVTNASLQPGAYQVRVFPYFVDGVRSDKQSLINGNFLRNFKIKERVTFQLRFDVQNVQNRSQFNGPTTNATSSTFGQVTNQTTSINRFYSVQGRIQF